MTRKCRAANRAALYVLPRNRHMTPASSQRPPNLRFYAEPDLMPASEAARIAMLLAIDEPDLLSEVQLARRVKA